MANRDDEHRRWLGEGTEDPRPTYVIEVDGDAVGWFDVDPASAHVGDGEANVGWFVFPEHRGHGYAAEAVRQHRGDEVLVAIIEVGNHASLRTASAAGFRDDGTVEIDRRTSRRMVR